MALLRFRNSKYWRELTNDNLSVDADVIPKSWVEFGGPTAWLAVATFMAMAWAAYFAPADSSLGNEVATVAQLVLAASLPAILPTFGLRYARSRWGPNPPTALVGFVLLLVMPLNAMGMMLAARLFPRITTRLGSRALLAAGVVGAGACVLCWLGTAWRARAIGQLKSRLQEQQARADAAVRDRQALEARLRALQAQIEPAFLTDTMSHVRELVQDKPEEAVVMLTNLVVEVLGSQQERKQLAQEARLDPLTRLPNRRSFEEFLEQAHKQAARDNGWVVVLFLDLNDFKRINDSLGHAAGDAVLQTFARRIRSAVRDADIVARLGGDEFTVLLSGPQAPDSGETVAHTIEGALAEPVEVAGRRLELHASIGIARGLAASASPASLLAEADAAMYRDKARRKQASPGPSARLLARDE